MITLYVGTSCADYIMKQKDVVSPPVDTSAASKKKGIKGRRSRTSSPLPSDHLTKQRRSSLMQSPSISQRRMANGRRPKHRVSYAGSPAQPQGGFDTPRPSSRADQRYSTGHVGQTSPGKDKKSSPPSVEAKKFAARIKREERVVEQKVERLNDNVLAMIRQGKEALGARVEITEGEDEEMGESQW